MVEMSPSESSSAEGSNGVGGLSELLSVEGACGFAGVSRMTIHRARIAGKLRCYKLGTAVRFSRRQLLDWFAASEVAGKAA